MDRLNRAARVAGGTYLLLALTAPFSLIYIPRTFIVKGDPAATAARILASETIFRLGILAELTTAVFALFLVLALYRLFDGVSRFQSALLVAFGAVLQAPIAFMNVLNKIAALTLLHGPAYLAAFDKRQLQAMAMLFLRLHGQGLIVEQIFWGLWLFPFGILVIRSGFIPKILGVLLLLNGVTYVFLSATSLLALASISVLSPFAFITELGELWIILWLLIRGAKPRPTPAAAAA